MPTHPDLRYAPATPPAEGILANRFNVLTATEIASESIALTKRQSQPHRQHSPLRRRGRGWVCYVGNQPISHSYVYRVAKFGGLGEPYSIAINNAYVLSSLLGVDALNLYLH